MGLKAHSGLNVVYTYDLDGLEVFLGGKKRVVLEEDDLRYVL